MRRARLAPLGRGAARAVAEVDEPMPMIKGDGIGRPGCSTSLRRWFPHRQFQACQDVRGTSWRDLDLRAVPRLL
jgi:hypothetical protein